MGWHPAGYFRLQRPMLVDAPRGSLATESLSSLDPASTTENEPRTSLTTPPWRQAPSRPSTFLDPTSLRPQPNEPTSSPLPTPAPLPPRPHADLVWKSRKLAHVFGHTPAAAIARPHILSGHARAHAACSLADPTTAAFTAVHRHSMPVARRLLPRSPPPRSARSRSSTSISMTTTRAYAVAPHAHRQRRSRPRPPQRTGGGASASGSPSCIAS